MSVTDRHYTKDTWTGLEGLEYKLLQRLEQNPDDLDARIMLGKLYREYGRYHEAREILEYCLARDPENQSVMHSLYATYRGLGLFSKANDIWFQIRIQSYRGQQC